jgi:hypothetical protein
MAKRSLLSRCPSYNITVHLLVCNKLNIFKMHGATIKIANCIFPKACASELRRKLGFDPKYALWWT